VALGTVRREQQNFGVAAIGVGGKDGGQGSAVHGLAEHEIAVREVDAGFVLGDFDVADAVAFGRIETGGEDLTAQFRGTVLCGGRLRGGGRDEGQDGGQDQQGEAFHSRLRCGDYRKPRGRPGNGSFR